MASTTSTTLSVAATADADRVNLTSASGVAAGTLLFVGNELMKVISISSTVAKVRRGLDGTRVIAHASGAIVYAEAAGSRVFYANDPAGTVTAALQPYLPVIVPSTGKIWDVENGAWVEVIQDRQTTVPTEGTVASDTTVAEYGEGRRHLTKITITAKDMEAVAANANESHGVLIYTFPAGTILVNQAYMSVGVDGTDSTNNADAPDVGLGTTQGDGAHATLDASGATDEDIITGRAAANCTGTPTVAGLSASTHIASGGAHTVYFNAADGWAGADTMLVIAGTVILDWTLIPA